MDAFDVIVLVVAVVAAIGGYRLGFFTRVLSWIGLALGVYLAVHFLPRIIVAVSLSSAAARLVVAAAVLIGAAFVGQALGMIVGSRLHAVLPLGPLRSLDKIVGALVGVVGVATALWLLLPTLSSVAGWPAQATQRSVIARWLSSTLPPPPNTLQALRRLVAGDNLPQVFDNLHVDGAVGPVPSTSPLARTVLRAAEDSTVKVQGPACNRIQDGSGFAVAPDLILTNAHVVAGEPTGSTSVLTPNGRTLPARVVLYDSNRDIALLEVPGLDEPAIPLAVGSVDSAGDVLGHPSGQIPLAVQPYAVAQQLTAVGEDLYDQHDTRRQIYVIASALEPGDSGAPLVNTDGRAIGVAFAISVGQADTAYALTTTEIEPDVRAARSGRAVSTGACLND